MSVSISIYFIDLSFLCFTKTSRVPTRAVRGLPAASQVRKRALATLRSAQDESSLRLRVTVAQKEALAESTWRERMMELVETGGLT